jgi:hypothetical protein
MMPFHESSMFLTARNIKEDSVRDDLTELTPPIGPDAPARDVVESWKLQASCRAAPNLEDWFDEPGSRTIIHNLNRFLKDIKAWEGVRELKVPWTIWEHAEPPFTAQPVKGKNGQLAMSVGAITWEEAVPILDALRASSERPPTPGPTPGEKRAIEVCLACPVRARCLQAGWEEPYGVWGGMTANQRRIELREAGRAGREPQDPWENNDE